MSAVALLPLDTYEMDEVVRVLRHGLDLIDPGCRLFAGDQILIKPNLLVPAPPRSGVCTHPSITAGLVDLVRERAASGVTVGDSPAVHSAAAVAEMLGLSEVLQSRDVSLQEFSDAQWMYCAEGEVCRRFPIARQVSEADGVVSAAKLKAHGLTRYTGATKNLYGCVVGTHKAQFHLRYHRVHEFSRMLADLALLIRPRLSVIDAVVSMEGAGPRSGDLRCTGFVVMALDPVTADAVACQLVGLSPREILHLRYAAESGMGAIGPEGISILGTDPQQLQVADFRVPSGRTTTTWRIPGPLLHLARRLFLPRPRISSDRCTGCGLCHRICPAEAIIPGQPGRVSQRDCICCYCCHEVCPEGAITLVRLGAFWAM